MSASADARLVAVTACQPAGATPLQLSWGNVWARAEAGTVASEVLHVPENVLAQLDPPEKLAIPPTSRLPDSWLTELLTATVEVACTVAMTNQLLVEKEKGQPL